MRLWLGIVGVVAVVGIGLAVIPSGGTEDPSGSNPMDRVSRASRAGAVDLYEGMTASKEGRSMFGSGRRPADSVRRADPTSESSTSSRPTRPAARAPSARDQAREAARAANRAASTTTTGRPESYVERQRKIAERIAEQRAQRAAARNGNRQLPPQTTTAVASPRDRLNEIKNRQATTGARTLASPTQQRSLDSSTSESGSQRGMDQATRDRLLSQLLESASKRQSGSQSSSSSNTSNSGSNNSNANSDQANSGPVTSTGGGGPTTIEGVGPPTTSASGAITASARWLPVAPESCDDLTGYRTNDLYLRLDGADRVIAVDSGASSPGITFDGAALRQAAGGADAPPSTSAVAADPCLAFDTFLDLGGGSFSVLTSGGASFGDSATGGTVVATWVSLAGIVGQQNPARFGDNGFYLRLGRFTAPTTVDAVGGQFLTQITPAEGGSPETLFVTVPPCATCWDGDDIPNDPPAPGNDDDDDDTGGDTDSDDDTNDDGDDADNPDTGDDADDGDDGVTGDPGDDTDDDGDSGDGTDPDDGDDTDDDGDTGDGSDPGDDGDDDTPIGVEAVWAPIDNTCDATEFDGCTEPTGFGTYDLYLRTDQPHFFTIIDSGDSSTGVTFGSALVFQSEGNMPLPPRPPGLPPRCPCLEFDSHLYFGNAEFQFLVAPDPSDWGDSLEAVWFASLGTTVQATQNTTFADGAYYVRVLRLTIEPVGTVGGEILAVGSVFGTGEPLAALVDIPPLP